MGKGSRLKRKRGTERALIERVETPLPQPDELPVEWISARSLRNLLLDRGWVDRPADGLLAQMRFEFPDSLIDFTSWVPREPDGIHPTTLLVCSEPKEAGRSLHNFKIYVELVGHDPVDEVCIQHTAPNALEFSFDDSGLTELADQINEIEQHVAHLSEMIACVDRPGLAT